VDLGKKNRQLTATCESQKAKITKLEGDVAAGGRGKNKDAKKGGADGTGPDGTNGNPPDPILRKNYAQARNQLQLARQEVQKLKLETNRQKRLLVHEFGSQEEVNEAEKALIVMENSAESGPSGGRKGKNENSLNKISDMQRLVDEGREKNDGRWLSRGERARLEVVKMKKDNLKLRSEVKSLQEAARNGGGGNPFGGGYGQGGYGPGIKNPSSLDDGFADDGNQKSSIESRNREKLGSMAESKRQEVENLRKEVRD